MLTPSWAKRETEARPEDERPRGAWAAREDGPRTPRPAALKADPSSGGPPPKMLFLNPCCAQCPPPRLLGDVSRGTFQNKSHHILPLLKSCLCLPRRRNRKPSASADLPDPHPASQGPPSRLYHHLSWRVIC